MHKHEKHKHPYANGPAVSAEDLRLEAVTVSVGFDDLLDAAIGYNHPHLDTLIVVTSHDDKKTQQVAQKHGAICVQTDLFKKNGRNFNKGAAINAGFARFQYNGWRLHLDADIVMPDNARRVLFNHAHLDTDCVYGCDRVDVVGMDAIHKLRGYPQHKHGCLVSVEHPVPVGARYVDTLYGYVPIGFWQLWHASNQHPYPYSLGTAAHDDVLFAAQWPASQRRQLSSLICYHLCARPSIWGENWDGARNQPRLDGGKK